MIPYDEIFPRLSDTIRHSRYKDYHVIYSLARSQYHVDRTVIKAALHIWRQHELENIPVDDKGIWELAATFDYSAKHAPLGSVNVDKEVSVDRDANSGRDMDLNHGVNVSEEASDQGYVDTLPSKNQDLEQPPTTQYHPHKRPRNFQGEELLDPLPQRLSSPERLLTVGWFCQSCLEHVKRLPCTTLEALQ